MARQDSRDSEVIRIVAAELAQPVPPAVGVLAQEIRRRHGEALLACLFYGSCLRDRTVEGRVVDFYAIARDHRGFHGNPVSAVLNAILPPNVYYLETLHEGQVLRAKYAVISLAQLRRDTSARCFLPTLWGRLAQPCALAYARDRAVEEAVGRALAAAAETLLRRTLPLMPPRFTSREIWLRGFTESYRTELRAERGGRAALLYEAGARRCDRMAKALLGASSPPSADENAEPGEAASLRHQGSRLERRKARLAWWGRRVLGRSLHVLRLAKAAYTFTGGLDYVLWKIETHSGVRAEPTPWQRRHPLIAAPKLAWQLYRRGAFR
jgi:hypothetical protein